MRQHGDHTTTAVAGKPKPKPKFLAKASSVAILQEPLVPRDEQRSSLADSVEAASAVQKNAVFDGSPQATVAVDISLRRGRIAVATVIIVSAIVAVMQFLQSGYEIHRYNKNTLDADQQKRLLDQYNSYSGNIVSVCSKPIELFVAACVQVILLRFVSASLLRNEPSWKTVYAALALSAGVGYLINNGFNALNAQLVDLEISSFIETSDLSLDDTTIAASSDWQDRVSNVSWSVSENQPLNPITNTVLRNVVQLRTKRAKSVCDPSDQFAQTSIPLDTVDYGFPQRDWMKQLLTEALPTTSMSFLLNPTNKSANNHLTSEDLPMNASIASNLVLYGVRLASEFTPFKGSLADIASNRIDGGLTHNISAAIHVGILPPDPSASDADQKKWLLKNINAYLTGAFNTTKNMTLTNIPMAFTRVEIAPNITFEAVTFEFEVNPDLLADSTDNTTGTRYANAGDGAPRISPANFYCGPWPALCVLGKRGPSVASELPHLGDQYYDVPAQIQAFSMCLNGNGTELMEAGHYLQGGTRYSFSAYLTINQCNRTSDTSMLVVSVGKRLVANALTENAYKTVYKPEGYARATNLRKLYSFTVGKLSWKLADIAAEFGATCNANGAEKCHGLALTLAKKSAASASQRLVVSGGAIPMDALLPPQLNNFIYYHAYRQQPITLVQVNEPTRLLVPDDKYDAAAGDILLPHNIRNITWNMSHINPGDICAYVEERAQRVLDNHMYIEHPIQATYTAALFYVLQNGVVKDVVTTNQSLSSTTTMLAFNGNTQKVALFLSTPSTNAILTQLGCLFLLLGVAASIAWATVVRNSTSRPNSLAGISNAEVIARAKLDEKTFPPLLLHRHVTNTSSRSVDRRELESLVIHLLSLQLRDADQAAAVGTEDSSIV